MADGEIEKTVLAEWVRPGKNGLRMRARKISGAGRVVWELRDYADGLYGRGLMLESAELIEARCALDEMIRADAEESGS